MERELTNDDTHGLLAPALLLTAISLVLTGIGIRWGNQAIQVPLIHWINDPASYPGDPFVMTLERYASLVWWGVAWVARVAPLDPLLAVLLVAQRFLLLLAAGHLARTLAPGSRTAPVAAMTMFALGADVPRPGAGTLVSNGFDQTAVAIALLMFSAASIWGARRWSAALWFAAGFTANPLYGIFAATFLAPMAVVRAGTSRRLAGWAGPLAVAGTLALPALTVSLHVVDWTGTPQDLWLRTAMVWLHYHLFPSLWPATAFLRFALASAALIVAIVAVWRQLPEMWRLATVWCLASWFWLALAWGAAAAPLPGLLLFQPGRATDLWFALGGVLLCGALSEAADRPASMEKRALGASALLCGLALWQGALLAYLAGAAALTLLAIPLRRRWHPAMRFGGLPSWLLVVAALPALLALAQPGHRILLRPPAAERQIGAWAASHTAEASVFLVPPEWQDFRGLSRRAVFVAWKDVSAILWDPTYVIPWQERMDALGLRLDAGHDLIHDARARLTGAFDALRDDDVVRLRERYGIDYWVIPMDHPTSLPERARAGGFRIVEIVPPRSGRPRAPARPQREANAVVQREGHHDASAIVPPT